MALAGHAAPVVLQSYDAERSEQHRALDDRQTTGFRRLVYRSRIGDVALDVAGKLIPNLGSKLFGSDDLQQLSMSFARSQMSEDHLKLKNALKSGVPHAGERAPDAALTAADGRTATLFPLIYNAEGHSWGWNLLAFDGRDPAVAAPLRAAMTAVAPWPFVRSTLIVSAPAAVKDEAGAKDSLSDLDGVAHAAYGLDGTPALVLVRPDGHIGYRGAADRPDLLTAYCRRVFAHPGGAG